MRKPALEHELDPWVHWFARIGFIARGTVYALIGYFALRSAAGHGRPSGSGGAIAHIDSSVAGSALLALLAAGLFCLVLWRVAQIGFGLMLEGKSLAANIAIRIGWSCSGCFYAGFAADVLHRMFARSPSDHGASLARVTGWTMHLPLGRFIIGAVGVGILAYAGWQLYRVASVRVVERLQRRPRHGIGAMVAWTIVAVSEFGVLARALVFVLVGLGVVAAAWRDRPGHSRGLSGALDAVRGQPHGHWLLGAIAIGLLAYAVFQLAMACWRRLDAGPRRHWHLDT